MLEEENSAECQHTSEKPCYDWKTTRDCLWIYNEIICNGWKNGTVLILMSVELHVTAVITVSVKFNLCPACYNIVVIKELSLIRCGASCSFTVPHKGCCSLVHRWMESVYWCLMSVLRVQRPTDWKPGCLDDPIGNQEVVQKLGRIRERDMNVLLQLIWWILHIHQLWIAQKQCWKQPIVGFIYSFLLSTCWCRQRSAGMQLISETLDM